jgi:hypothetical protein
MLLWERILGTTSWFIIRPWLPWPLSMKDGSSASQTTEDHKHHNVRKSWLCSNTNEEASGLQTGYSTLDSIRAALKSSNFTGLGEKPITTLHGYSGGSIGAGWVSISLE